MLHTFCLIKQRKMLRCIFKSVIRFEIQMSLKYHQFSPALEIFIELIDQENQSLD